MKKFYQSKTFWFFLLSLVVAIASAFGYADFVPEEAFGEVGVAIISVLGIVLRLISVKVIDSPLV